MITLERCRVLEHELHIADVEIDDVIRTYYTEPGGQNVGGNIGEISRMHAQLVERLAEVKRGLMGGGSLGGTP